MSFTFNTGIPATNNNPSVDQPDMLTNNQSTNSILAVDHVSFNTANGGTHKQVTYISKNTPGAQVDPVSTAYTDNGIANATHPQMYYRNSQGIFSLSALRAGAIFTTQLANGAVVPSNSLNISSIVASVNGTTYTITLTANAVNGNDVIVHIDVSNDASATYTFAGGVLTIVTSVPVTTPKIGFTVLQF